MKGKKFIFWYLQVLKKYSVFIGRARRREYWIFFLINCVITLFVFSVLALSYFISDIKVFMSFISGFYFLYIFAITIPGIAVLVRRLHDTGRTGWWWLIGFVPFIGSIILFIFLIQNSYPKENRYGPNPKTFKL